MQQGDNADDADSDSEDGSGREKPHPPPRVHKNPATPSTGEKSKVRYALTISLSYVFTDMDLPVTLNVPHHFLYCIISMFYRQN